MEGTYIQTLYLPGLASRVSKKGKHFDVFILSRSPSPLSPHNAITDPF